MMFLSIDTISELVATKVLNQANFGANLGFVSLGFILNCVVILNFKHESAIKLI